MEKVYDDEYECFDLVYIKEGLELNSISDSGTVFEVTDLDSRLEDLESCYSYCSSERKEVVSGDLFSKENDENTVALIGNSFDELSKEFVSITEDNLVMKQIVKSSAGINIPPKSNVTVHYNAYLEYSYEPFDSTKLREKTFNFDLGSGTTIEGFEIAVATMKKKEISRFLICPEYAYGKTGCPPRIPPEAICLYVIEVIDFIAPGDNKAEYFSILMKERKYAPFDVMMEGYNHIRNIAKKYFHNNQFYLALKSYLKALTILENHNLKNEEEENQLKSELIKLHTNAALCHLKLKQSVRAIHHCNEIFRLQDENNIKALYFKGKALRQIGEFKRALIFLERANYLKPKKKEILLELKKAKRNYELFFDCILNCENDKVNDGVKHSQDLEQFKLAIENSIKSFQIDDDIVELPLPSFHFTNDQIQVLKNIAIEYDLLVKETKNSDNEILIYIYKKFKNNDEKE